MARITGALEIFFRIVAVGLGQNVVDLSAWLIAGAEPTKYLRAESKPFAYVLADRADGIAMQNQLAKLFPTTTITAFAG